jgi:hypothetical protein
MSPADAFGSPILTSEWNAFTDLLRKLPKQSAEPLAVLKILKLAPYRVPDNFQSLPPGIQCKQSKKLE